MIRNPSTFWTPLFFILVVNAATQTHEFLENSDLLAGCRFNLGQQIYDLCPLMLERGTREAHSTAWVLDEATGLSLLSRRLYSFAFRGVRHDQQCPKGTWICMSETRGSDNPQHTASEWVKHTAIAGKLRHESSLVDQGINAVASIFDNDFHSTSPLNLFFNGGLQNDKPRYARIEFVCDPSLESADPLFSGEQHGVHSFTWSTKYGCPIANPNATLRSDYTLHALDEDTNDPPPNSEDSKDDGEQELLDPKVPREVFRRWVTFVLLTTGTFLIIVTLVLASSRIRFAFISHLHSLATTLRLPALYNRALSWVPKPFQFRASEGSLMRWAQEDMSLAVLEVEEVDVMVNGGVVFGVRDEWDGEGMYEYIPLKAGPLRGKRDYGSARGARLW